MESGIYIIKNTINKKVYIGSAVYFNDRFSKHKRDLLKNKHHNPPLQSFVNKYGFDTLSFEILEVVLDKNKLIEREQFYIDSYKFHDLFNILKIAGSPLGHKHTESSKKKLSERLKGNTRGLGYKHSEASKKKMSKSQKGRIFSEDHKKKISESRIGKKHSEAAKKKISESQKGRIFSEDHKKNLRKSQVKKVILIFRDGVLIDRILGTNVASKKYNLNLGHISDVCNGKRKTTGGYTMKYA